MLYRSNWPLLANLDTFIKAWIVSMVHYVQHGPHKRTKYYANVIDYFRYIKILTWLQGCEVRKQKKYIIHY